MNLKKTTFRSFLAAGLLTVWHSNSSLVVDMEIKGRDFGPALRRTTGGEKLYFCPDVLFPVLGGGNWS